MQPPEPTPAAIGRDQAGGRVSTSPATTAIGQKGLTCRGRGEEGKGWGRLGEQGRPSEEETKIKEEEKEEHRQEREEQL